MIESTHECPSIITQPRDRRTVLVVRLPRFAGDTTYREAMDCDRASQLLNGLTFDERATVALHREQGSGLVRLATYRSADGREVRMTLWQLRPARSAQAATVPIPAGALSVRIQASWSHRSGQAAVAA